MESIHGIDVSWIHSTHNKDNLRASKAHKNKPVNPEKKSPPVQSDPPTPVDATPPQNGTAQPPNDANGAKALPHRPNLTRSASAERATPNNPPKTGTSPRRNTWLTSLSSKFSSSPGTPNTSNGVEVNNLGQSPPTPEVKPPGGSAPKNSILPHAGKAADGSVPYVPAPPRTGQGSFFSSALRRLSSNSGAQLSNAVKGHHGLCERRVLNVDATRERCRVPELNQGELRRVAFCVDVEIAGGPRYTDEDDTEDRKKEKNKKKKMVEKGEGEALKKPQEVKEEKEQNGVIKASGEEVPREPEKEGVEKPTITVEEAPEKETTKKKEKKKRSEEERKARKEKKRKLAEQNGTVPVEIFVGSDESLPDSATGKSKTQAAPTTDPVRIYRRCCQLRETPILKKITELLGSSINSGGHGVVSKLDLSGYWLQLPDLVTLGDFLAVVPVKELIMDNCGLTDEGLRVILAGLLAAKLPERRKLKSEKPPQSQPVHVVERVVLKNNPKIGRDGWRHIFFFIHMSKSLKAMDLSMIPFPQTTATTTNSPAALHRTDSSMSLEAEMSSILSKALGDRLGGHELELLNMAETGITTDQLGSLIDGAIKCGLRRMGLAGNHISSDGILHVARYLKEGKCEGLDLGGNELRSNIEIIANSLNESHPLWALSLAGCDLTPECLWKLFPVLAKLPNFRFIDLSHNRELFDSRPSALGLLRKYIPRMPVLKRIHLTDVSLNPDQAIALAEILPECEGLAHVNILENPLLSALANAVDEAHQEEACALYASLMAAVRVSHSLVCIDIDVPSADSSEIVKALAKQVVAYCLRNMERGPVAEIAEAAATITEPHGGAREVSVPDVLLHLVGHVEDFHENHDDDEPAPDQDYVIGGTGVVKALGICLRNKGNDSRRPSADRTYSDWSEAGAASGVQTPSSPAPGASSKAKDMSKNLLGSARKIRARLQPALVKERSSSDRQNYQRLLFLDQTLERMIQRFEDEYPETRLSTNGTSEPVPELPHESSTELSLVETQSAEFEQAGQDVLVSDDEEGFRPALSRHNSDVSLASKALSQEEGRMHRFGQRVRRDILKPDTEDHEHGTTGKEQWAPHLEFLRAMIEDLGGEEIKQKVEEGGEEAVIKELTEDASTLRQKLIDADPEGWEKFRLAQEAAQRNMSVAGLDPNMSAIE